MIDMAVIEDPHPAVVALHHAMDELLAVDLDTLTQGGLLALMRGLETERRRLPAVDHGLIGELEVRSVAAAVHVRNTAAVLTGLLRVSPGEASSRVNAAALLGPRTALTGQVLPPVFPLAASAQRDGVISAEHARVITGVITHLPATVREEHGDTAEQILCHQAAELHPTDLARTARRLTDTLDPDGTLASDADRARRRALSITTRADGTATLAGELDPACTAALHAVLSPLAAPRPDADGTRDPRTAAQRNHDGLADALMRVLRSGSLPHTGGAPVTILVTTTLAELQQQTGLARTSSGDLIALPTLLGMAAEADLIPVFMNDTGGIMAYGRTIRLAPANHRRVLAARDGGCSRPGCTIPPDWCQVHHITEWVNGGTTDIDSMALVCAYDHLTVLEQGWDIVMIEGMPHWRAPKWLDPDRTPRRNTAHHQQITFEWTDPNSENIDPETDTDQPQANE